MEKFVRVDKSSIAILDEWYPNIEITSEFRRALSNPFSIKFKTISQAEKAKGLDVYGSLFSTTRTTNDQSSESALNDLVTVSEHYEALGFEPRGVILKFICRLVNSLESRFRNGLEDVMTTEMCNKIAPHLCQMASDMAFATDTLDDCAMEAFVNLARLARYIQANCTLENVYYPTFHGFCCQSIENLECDCFYDSRIDTPYLFEKTFYKQPERLILYPTLVTDQERFGYCFNMVFSVLQMQPGEFTLEMQKTAASKIKDLLTLPRLDDNGKIAKIQPEKDTNGIPMAKNWGMSFCRAVYYGFSGLAHQMEPQFYKSNFYLAAIEDLKYLYALNAETGLPDRLYKELERVGAL